MCLIWEVREKEKSYAKVGGHISVYGASSFHRFFFSPPKKFFFAHTHGIWKFLGHWSNPAAAVTYTTAAAIPNP